MLLVVCGSMVRVGGSRVRLILNNNGPRKAREKGEKCFTVLR